MTLTFPLLQLASTRPKGFAVIHQNTVVLQNIQPSIFTTSPPYVSSVKIVVNKALFSFATNASLTLQNVMDRSLRTAVRGREGKPLFDDDDCLRKKSRGSENMVDS